MVSIVLSIILGLLFTVIAVQNPVSVPVNLFGSTYSIPVYVLGAFAFLLGLFIALIYHVFHQTTAVLDLHTKDVSLREAAEDNQNLRNEIQKLTAENHDLRNQLGHTRTELTEEKVESTGEKVRNFFRRPRTTTA